MKRTKLSTLLFALACMTCSAVAFSACGLLGTANVSSSSSSVHTHAFGAWAATEATKELPCEERVWTRSCTCGEKEEKSGGHLWGDVQTVEPTYMQQGYDVQVCEGCGEEQKGNYVPMLISEGLGKSAYELWLASGKTGTEEQFLAATLDVDEQNLGVSCSHSDADKLFWVLAEHTYDGNVITDGLYLYVCQVPTCDFAEIKRTVFHDYQTEQYQDATCLLNARVHDKCTICGHVINAREVPDTTTGEHEWSVWKPVFDDDTVVEVNLCEDGYREAHICKKCGEGEVKVHEPEPHKTVEWTVSAAPTDAQEGLLVGTCSKCEKDDITVVIPKLDENVRDNYAISQTFTVLACDQRDGLEHYTIYVEQVAELVNGEYVVNMQQTAKKGYQAVLATSLVLGPIDHAILGNPVENRLYAWDTPGIQEPEDKQSNCAGAGSLGVGVYTCSNCQGVYSVVTERVHNFDIRETLVDSTCCEEGEYKETCSHCGATRTGVISEKAHNLSYKLEASNDATYPYIFTETCVTVGCQTAGVQCTYSDSKLLTLDDVTIEPATCIAQGYVQYVTDNGTPVRLYTGYAWHTLNGQYIDPNGVYDMNVWGDYIIELDDSHASCGNGDGVAIEGFGVYECEIRGCSGYQSIKTTKSHTYVFEEVVVPATCLVGGVKHIQCGVCGFDGNEEIPALGHTIYEGLFVDGEYYVEGQDVYFYDDCIRCGTPSYIIPANELTYTETDKANCQKEGTGEYSYTKTITIAGITADKTYTLSLKVAKTVHDLNGQLIYPGVAYEYNTPGISEIGNNKATCITNGEGVFTCSTCQGIYSVTTKKSSHTYATQTQAPTCTEQGVTTSTCTICNTAGPIEYVPKLGHTYTSEIVTAPTLTTTGMAKIVCATCGHVERSVLLPALNATDYVETKLVDATCTTQGVSNFTLTVTGCDRGIVDANGDPITQDVTITIQNVTIGFGDHNLGDTLSTWLDTIDGIEYIVQGKYCSICDQWIVLSKTPRN